MKDFAVAYGMARRGKNMQHGAPVMQAEANPEDMIQAIIRRRMEKQDAEPRELGFNNEGDQIGGDDNLPIDETPVDDRRARIAKILGR